MEKTIAMGKTQFRSMAFASVIYYLVYFVVTVGISFFFKYTLQMDGVEITGNSSFNSTIFLFVMGIVFIRSSFYFGTSNAVSRKSIFLSITVLFLLLSLATAAVDLAVNWQLMSNLMDFTFVSKNFLSTFLFQYLMYVTTIFAGALVSLIYYRLNKIGKWIFSVAGALCVMFGPVVLGYIAISYSSFALWIGRQLGNFLRFFARSAWNGALIMLILAVVLLIGEYLLIRRAPVKDTGNV